MEIVCVSLIQSGIRWVFKSREFLLASSRSQRYSKNEGDLIWGGFSIAGMEGSHALVMLRWRTREHPLEDESGHWFKTNKKNRTLTLQWEDFTNKLNKFVSSLIPVVSWKSLSWPTSWFQPCNTLRRETSQAWTFIL